MSGPHPNAPAATASREPVPVWIFAYGSLLWRPSFAYRERRVVQLRDWSRQFWQGSTDHRGVPGAPGRVVTLVPEPGAACCGTAYRVDAQSAQAVIAELDHRERGGYTRTPVDLPFGSALTYIALPDNPNYLGPASLATIAAQVRAAQGPSGTNLDYVLRLAESVRELGAEDRALFALEALLRGREAA
jgi:cation transport regulator ChaC